MRRQAENLDQAVATPCTPAIRGELALLIRRGNRTEAFTREAPTHWTPTQVVAPGTGQPFTPAGAWEFVAEHLEAGTPVEAILLIKPRGKTGYVMIVGGHGTEEIYIKVQMGSGMVIGRSFHASTTGDGR